VSWGVVGITVAGLAALSIRRRRRS
jgi:LPXTG-motif cell wall-anchored protein